jgi:hypothetical protein
MEGRRITLLEDGGGGLLYDEHAKSRPLLLHRPVSGGCTNHCRAPATAEAARRPVLCEGCGLLCLERSKGLHGSGRRRRRGSGDDDVEAIRDAAFFSPALPLEKKKPSGDKVRTLL